MTEERKIQLVTEVDASGSKAGFEQVKQAGRDMAQSVVQSGQAAGKGLDSITDGAKRAGDGLTREEGRIRSAIQRATLDLQTLGAAASDKLSAKIDIQGLDPAKFQPYIAALRAVEQEQQRILQQRAGSNFIEGLQGQIAALREQAVAQEGGTEALLRYKAAQAGVAGDAAPLILQLQNIKAAMADKAAADTQAVASAKAQSAALKEQTTAQESFLSSLRDRAANTGLDPTAQLRARASQLGVTEQAEPLISQVNAAQTAQQSKAFTDSLQAQIAATREQRIAQEGGTEALLRYKAAQAGAAEASAPLIHELTQLRTAQEAVARAAADSAAAQKAAAAQVVQRSSFIDDLKQQSAAIGKTRADMMELRAAELGLAADAAPYIAKLREAEQGHRGLGGSAQFTTQQIQGLTHSVRAAFDSIASGQSPIRAVAVETGRLSGTFGGIGNAVTAVTSLITPFRVAMVAGAAALAALGAAAFHTESVLRELNTVQAQLAGTGRAGLFDNAGLKAFINELALAPGVTRTTATAILSELAKVHDVGGGLFKDLGRLTVDYAAATGQKVPEAAKALAQAFADPAKGAKTLEEALGTLSSTQILTVEKLARLGDTAGAQKALLDALQGSVKGLADNAMTPLQKSINELGNAWERSMQKLGQSDGLRALNALLAKTIDGVTWLIEHGDKISSFGERVGSIIAPPGAKAVFGAIVGSLVPTEVPTGDFARKDRAAATTSSGRSKADTDEGIKRALEAGKAFKSEAGQIAELREQRERLNKALKDSIDLYGKSSPQAKQLRDNVAGINERIAAAGKKGGGGNEAQQVLDAQLEQRVKASKDALAAERDSLAFSQHYLQGVYQAGAISLRDFYDQKRQAISQGVAAEVAELDKERTAVQEHLEATKKTSPKDASALVKDQTRLREIDAEQAKLRTGAARETVLANQEEAASFKQLGEQVLTYRANLLQLQGDEAGAAKVRAQIANEQAKVLAAQSGGAISQKDVDAFAKATEQSNALALSRNRLNAATQQLAIEEERISFLQGKGSIGEIEALGRLASARSARLGQLQKEVDELEKLSKERPEDLQLKVDVSRAQLEIEKLKASLDPLKDKFDGIFKDAGANLFSDLATGTKPLDAIKNFANSIQREISATVGKQLSAQVFGDGGLLGGLGKATADVFGGKARKGVALDTSSAEQSLASLRTAGVDPATTALAALTESAQATAVALRQITGKELPPAAGGSGTTGDFARFDRRSTADVPAGDGTGSTGDFARFDRQSAISGEQATMDLFRSADTAAAANGRAAVSVLNLATAAVRGGGALNSLPSVVTAIMQAAASSGSGGGGGLLGSVLGLVGGGGGSSAFAAGGVASSGFGTGAAFGNLDMGLFLSTGGYTGDVDPSKAAGIVHGKEYVFSAPAVAAIGVDRLERMHRKAKTGRVDQADVPGYSDGGYVSTLGSGLPQTQQRVLLMPAPAPLKAGDTYVTHHHHIVTVQPPPGMTRQTALQRGAEVGRGIELSMTRNGKR